MNLPRIFPSSIVLAASLTATVAVPAALAEDYVATGTIAAAASRCSDFGSDFIEMGNGVCGRLGGEGLVQLGTRSVNSNAWTSGGTSTAALRSDGLLPGGSTHHLRVRSGLDTPPYQ